LSLGHASARLRGFSRISRNFREEGGMPFCGSVDLHALCWCFAWTCRRPCLGKAGSVAAIALWNSWRKARSEVVLSTITCKIQRLWDHSYEWAHDKAKQRFKEHQYARNVKIHLIGPAGWTSYRICGKVEECSSRLHSLKVHQADSPPHIIHYLAAKLACLLDPKAQKTNASYTISSFRF
jgi:hypothetical protein